MGYVGNGERPNGIATRDPDSDDVIIKVVNPSIDQDVAADVSIKGRDVQQFRRWRVWSPNIDDANSLAEPVKVAVRYDVTDVPVLFPAHSVTGLRTYQGLIGYDKTMMKKGVNLNAPDSVELAPPR